MKRGVTFVMTSCGRVDLLKRTLSSFMRANTYPIERYIIIDDSASVKTQKEIEDYVTLFDVDMMFIFNKTNIGQVNSIDSAYSFVDTDYIFHCENDWEFLERGFIEKSMAILEADPKILTVWLRGGNDTNGHPVEMNKSYAIYDTELQNKITDYYLMSVNALGGNWHGFTWNPGLRRKSDYEIVKPFGQFIEPNDFAALTECRIGIKYFELGYRAAILPEKYCKHIG